ncbi:hypothetical protein KRR39_21960 [Nocardioides panacis]|uniref:Uncharacterized protein n=1 Tax=Nocardioides panacis TaxID=2849501 RepID=A0A975Y009_9ACTN|nr:hypothetical protein [Nocardioides panacis]QWZ07986.1 hypothetical protein KRR39_21960 [Nocardioides panacis]
MALAAAAHDVEVTIDAIRQIANSTLTKAETDASHSSSSFKNLTLDVSAFGASPLGQELGHQHRGAHEVFVETIDGTIKDLQDFRQKLLDAMNNHESTDDAAQQLLLGISKKYDGHTFHSSRSYDQARHDQAENLTTSTTPVDGVAPPAETETPAPADPPGGATFS